MARSSGFCTIIFFIFSYVPYLLCSFRGPWVNVTTEIVRQERTVKVICNLCFFCFVFLFFLWSWVCGQSSNRQLYWAVMRGYYFACPSPSVLAFFARIILLLTSLLPLLTLVISCTLALALSSALKTNTYFTTWATQLMEFQALNSALDVFISSIICLQICS